MPSRDIRDLTPFLQTAFLTIKERFEFEHARNGLFLNLICTHRPASEQFQLWKQGRENGKIVDKKKVVTNCDGQKTKSNHNYFPARAFDVGIFEGAKYKPTHPLYAQLGRYTAGLAVRWGGNFKRLKGDYPHFEEL